MTYRLTFAVSECDSKRRQTRKGIVISSVDDPQLNMGHQIHNHPRHDPDQLGHVVVHFFLDLLSGSASNAIFSSCNEALAVTAATGRSGWVHRCSANATAADAVPLTYCHHLITAPILDWSRRGDAPGHGRPAASGF